MKQQHRLVLRTRPHVKILPTVLLTILMFILAAVFLYPLFMILQNSFKNHQEITHSLFAWPSALHLENYARAWLRMKYERAFLNSLLITALSTSGLVLLSSMAAYKIVRRVCMASKILFYGILTSMAIPFQILMIPTVIMARELHIVDTTYGVILMYWGFWLPLSLFLYQGFIKSVPRDLEEAAMIDGCGDFRIFFRIVFPLLRPITATVVIINSIGIFNDFMLPLIMLSSDDVKTLPLALSKFFSSYMTEWNLIMAALALMIIPILLFFLVMQKNIINGLADGAIKG